MIISSSASLSNHFEVIISPTYQNYQPSHSFHMNHRNYRNYQSTWAAVQKAVVSVLKYFSFSDLPFKNSMYNLAVVQYFSTYLWYLHQRKFFSGEVFDVLTILQRRGNLFSNGFETVSTSICTPLEQSFNLSGRYCYEIFSNGRAVLLLLLYQISPELYSWHLSYIGPTVAKGENNL